MSPPPQPSRLGSDIAAVARNPLVQAGADAVGSAFGDPELGQQIAGVASVLAVPINMIADLADGSVYYSPEQVALNQQLVAAGDTGFRPIAVPGQRVLRD